MTKMGFEKFTIRRKFGNKPETCEIGGKTCNFRSQSEKKVAKYLQLLVDSDFYQDWAFEQTMFRFDNPILQNYVMDFDVLRKDGTFFYVEVKGLMDKYSRDRITVLLTERPEVELWVVFTGKKEMAKFMRRKISRLCKRICTVAELTKGIF